MTRSDGARIYRQISVYEAALRRIRWLFDEFKTVAVAVSGGKDSTVALELTLQVAREKGRDVPVVFLDQEIEWDSAIEQVRYWMGREHVIPYWVQVPFWLYNASSYHQPWLDCWHEASREVWIRDKEPDAIHENRYGVDRFHDLFSAVYKREFGSDTAIISGMKASECMMRMVGMTSAATYKGETWGKVIDRRRRLYLWHPLYDWLDHDVWAAIANEGWRYCRLYDAMYAHGMPIQKMRLSNPHHETAVENVMLIHEIEPDLWERILRRIQGAHAVVQQGPSIYAPTRVPDAFADWWDYRDYLLEHLITDPKDRGRMRQAFDEHDRTLGHRGDAIPKIHVQCILKNDTEGVLLKYYGFNMPSDPTKKPMGMDQ